MIKRLIHDQINANLFSGKAIILLGPRQVGKTTLLKNLASGHPVLWLNADEPDVRSVLNQATSTALRNMIGKNKIVIIDEAQRLENAGLTLKLITDNINEVQLIATGSSSFELSDKIKESLAGRKWEYHLFPMATEELINHQGALEEKRLLEHRLIYGYYPEVVTSQQQEREILRSIAESVLYKDVLALEQIKKPATLERLLKALALQMGQEVSFQELGQIVEADKETVERYIYILEQAFIIFRLPAFSRNARNELKRARKIYFYDNGIRNSIIANFNTLALRTDKGALWENYLVSERMKFTHYNRMLGSSYFWRTAQQQEIDYIEDRDGILHAFEFKWTGSSKLPKTFSSAYPEHTFNVINTENYLDFVTHQ
ncbi:MAG TPA: ATP-binding protein [Cyclobacteriaceae bacterium]|nr:ATP-binding protein [Cyclobacteriaceae bacterium]